MSVIEKEKVEVFRYSAKDFLPNVNENDSESKFDSLLKQKWEGALKNGIFRYTLHIKKWKVLEGNSQFLAQLNLDRASNRRKPEHVSSLKQPFDPQTFNFLKISDKEIYFDVEKGDGNNVFIANVSPIEWGHCLFVPERFRQLPQIMTKYSLQKVLELLLTSDSPNLRVVFNGLCAHASVNHLHWHFYHLKHRMLLETIDLANFVPPVCTLDNFPSKGFCVKLSLIHDLEKFVNVTYFMVNFLQDKNVAHNVFVTRAKSTETKQNFDDVRIYVWARKPSFGVKDTTAFIPAVCELFGHLVIRSEEAYETLSEDEVSHELNDVTSDSFHAVYDEMKIALQQFLKEQ